MKRFNAKSLIASLSLIATACGGGGGEAQNNQHGIFRIEEQLVMYPSSAQDGDDTPEVPTNPGGGNTGDGDDPNGNPGGNPGGGNTGDGDDPNGNPGTDPGTNPGTDPGTNPGTDPGTNPGTDPGTNPGTDPGTNPGTDPGTNPGTDPGTNPGTDPGTNPGTDPTNPGGNPNPGTDPVIPKPKPKPKPVVKAPDIHIPVIRACWDRPKNWPTVNRVEDDAVVTILDPAGNGLHTFEVDGDDFKKKGYTIKIAGETLVRKGVNLALNPKTMLRVCQMKDRTGRCIGNWDDGDYLAPGLIFVKKGVFDNDKRYNFAQAPFNVHESMPLQNFGVYKPIEIIVENIGQYDGGKRDQIRKDYCDVVYKTTSPLALDLSGKGFLPRKQSDGAMFDLDADGEIERMSTLGLEAGLLALDISGNGKIDDGSELFGDATRLDGGPARAKNGFEALAQHDLNADKKIDAQDAIFKDLRLWIDANNNGESEADELKTLVSLDVKELSLAYQSVNEIDVFGNQILEQSHYLNGSGASRYFVDIWFLTISEMK